MPNFHPILAGTPAAFVFLLLVFEIVAWRRPGWITNRTLLIVLLLTVGSIGLTFLSGYQALDFINYNCAVPEDLIAQHHTIGKALMFGSVALLVLGYFRYNLSPAKRWLVITYYSLLIMAAIAIVITGQLGGDLVFKYGVAVEASCPE